MIEAYYSCGCDSKDLFSKYEISSATDFEEYLNKYNLIHLDIASFTDYEEPLHLVISDIIRGACTSQNRNI